MATYAIGDLQGCFKPFLELLDRIHFDPKLDRLWLVGDIVNRGPNSLELLQFIKQMDETNHCVITVLGNHDLHLLMVAAKISQQRSGDTLQPLLDAPDCEDLLYWLRHQRLFYHEGNFAMVHAGLLPSWTIPQAAQLAQEVEHILQQDDYSQQCIQLYGNEPRVCGHWSALGVYQRENLIALDSGCVWGKQLSAVRLEDRKLFQVACDEQAIAVFLQ